LCQLTKSLSVYADLDVECVRSMNHGLDPYLVGSLSNTTAAQLRGIAIFGRMGVDESFEESIPNAWMASSPRHPFFIQVMKQVQDDVNASKSFWRKLWFFPTAEHMTGPFALRKNILRWKSTSEYLQHRIVLLPADMIYPFSWRSPEPYGYSCFATSDQFNEAECKKIVKVEQRQSLTITYWSHTHDGTRSNTEHIDRVNHNKF
jgi:inositol phosphorylceramide mannosyltransferase catalytic subunit